MVIDNATVKGVIPGFGMKDYHSIKLDRENLNAGPISCSMLKRFAVNPYAWRWTPETQQTAAMRKGSLFDAALTDPDRITDLVAISPFDNFRTKEAQQWKVEKEEAGITICNEDELVHALEAANLVRLHPVAGKILSAGCEFQVAVFGEIADIPAKALLDILPKSNSEWGDSIIDYKTTSAGLDDESIRRTIGQYKYHWQAAYYRTLFNSISTGQCCDRFVFIFQDVTTLEVRVVELHSDALALGVRAVGEAVKEYVKCAHNGIKSRYAKKADKLDLLPYVAMNEDDWINSLLDWK
jgi:hypothetical protein